MALNDRLGKSTRTTARSVRKLSIPERPVVLRLLLQSGHFGADRVGVLAERRDRAAGGLPVTAQRGRQQGRQRPDGVFIFVAPPSMEELERRREQRHSESRLAMDERQKTAEEEMSHAARYDYVVVNDDLERAVKEVQQIIRKERARRIKVSTHAD